MLVLSRKVGERIQLGDQITVTLVKINGNIVRLGIDAPPHMSVMRQELADRVRAESSSVEATKEHAAR
jgi:carbon storage regulator